MFAPSHDVNYTAAAFTENSQRIHQEVKEELGSYQIEVTRILLPNTGDKSCLMKGYLVMVHLQKHQFPNWNLQQTLR